MRIGILRVQYNMHGGFCTPLPIVKLCYHTVHLHRYMFSDYDVVYNFLDLSTATVH